MFCKRQVDFEVGLLLRCIFWDTTWVSFWAMLVVWQ